MSAPPEAAYELAEALDDLISERGVTLDDDRLDWLAAFVAAREAKAAAAALEAAADSIQHLASTVGVRQWLRDRAALEAADDA
jgi:dsDNA-binding SOS-regulon protein